MELRCIDPEVVIDKMSWKIDDSNSNTLLASRKVHDMKDQIGVWQIKDPKSTPDNPRWFMVDIESVKTFEPLFTLEDLRRQQNLADLLALRRGNRFSVMPVTIEYYQQIIRLRSA